VEVEAHPRCGHCFRDADALEGATVLGEVQVRSHTQGERHAVVVRALEDVGGHDGGDEGLLGVEHAGESWCGRALGRTGTRDGGDDSAQGEHGSLRETLRRTAPRQDLSLARGRHQLAGAARELLEAQRIGQQVTPLERVTREQQAALHVESRPQTGSVGERDEALLGIELPHLAEATVERALAAAARVDLEAHAAPAARKHGSVGPRGRAGRLVHFWRFSPAEDLPHAVVHVEQAQLTAQG